MLVFNKNSWHHKLYCVLHSYDGDYYKPPIYFCTYARQIMVALCFCFMISIMVGFALFCLVVPLLYFSDTLLGLFPETWNLDFTFVMGGVLIWTIGGLVFAIYHTKEWLIGRRVAKYALLRDAERNGTLEPEQKSLFGEWYKAFKGRFCPIMSFS